MAARCNVTLESGAFILNQPWSRDELRDCLVTTCLAGAENRSLQVPNGASGRRVFQQAIWYNRNMASVLICVMLHLCLVGSVLTLGTLRRQPFRGQMGFRLVMQFYSCTCLVFALLQLATIYCTSLVPFFDRIQTQLDVSRLQHALYELSYTLSFLCDLAVFIMALEWHCTTFRRCRFVTSSIKTKRYLLIVAMVISLMLSLLRFLAFTPYIFVSGHASVWLMIIFHVLVPGLLAVGAVFITFRAFVLIRVSGKIWPSDLPQVSGIASQLPVVVPVHSRKGTTSANGLLANNFRTSSSDKIPQKLRSASKFSLVFFITAFGFAVAQAINVVAVGFVLWHLVDIQSLSTADQWTRGCEFYTAHAGAVYIALLLRDILQVLLHSKNFYLHLWLNDTFRKEFFSWVKQHCRFSYGS